MFFRRNKTKTQADAETHTQIVTDTICLAEERLDVGIQEIEGDTVRVVTSTETEILPLSAELRRENYRVERVAIDEPVDTIPEIRKVDGTTIIPVLEERLVVTKQIVLREEIHLIPEHSVESYEDAVNVRRQTAEIERIAAE